jgi:hypothetical protein
MRTCPSRVGDRSRARCAVNDSYRAKLNDGYGSSAGLGTASSSGT